MLHILPLYISGNEVCYPVDRKLFGPQSWSLDAAMKRKELSLLEIEPQSSGSQPIAKLVFSDQLYISVQCVKSIIFKIRPHMFRPLFRTSEVTTFTKFFHHMSNISFIMLIKVCQFVKNRMSIKGLVVTNKLYYIITKHDVDKFLYAWPGISELCA
jgi:hypothetical protein